MIDEPPTSKPRPDDFRITGDVAWNDVDLDPSILRLRLEYSLQHDRDVWRPTREYPFLEIDGEALAAHVKEGRRITVLGSGFVIQNLRSDDARRILAARMVGGGVDAGLSSTGHHFALGAVNPNAFFYMAFNSPFMIGVHSYLAQSPWLVVVEEDGSLYQYEVAELRVREGRSYPHSEVLPLDTIDALGRAFWDTYIRRRDPLGEGELVEVSDFLDRLFQANGVVHREALLHHLRNRQGGPKFDYEAPILSTFGRLVHDGEGKPAIEHNLSVLHYRKAIHEYNAAKTAHTEGRRDDAIIHGVYCVVAIAAAVESVANKVFFVSKGAHVDRSEDRTPLDRLLEEAESITRARLDKDQRRFRRLKQSSDEAKAIEEVRRLRNNFSHAVELPVDIDPVSQQSQLLSAVSVENCRRLLNLTRLGLRHVLDQLPEVRDTISLNGLVWLGDLEVP